MVLKVHKIRNVDKAVCCKEQDIAYNIAVTFLVNWADEEYNNMTKSAKDDLYKRYFAISIRGIDSKIYNIDAIFCAYMYGIHDYIEGRHHVLTTYEQIGQAFPILYPIE